MGFVRECLNFFKAIKNKIKLNLSGAEFLCDTCRYNYREACKNPKRPNARSCDDYKHK